MTRTTDPTLDLIRYIDAYGATHRVMVERDRTTGLRTITLEDATVITGFDSATLLSEMKAHVEGKA